MGKIERAPKGPGPPRAHERLGQKPVRGAPRATPITGRVLLPPQYRRYVPLSCDVQALPPRDNRPNRLIFGVALGLTPGVISEGSSRELRSIIKNNYIGLKSRDVARRAPGAPYNPEALTGSTALAAGIAVRAPGAFTREALCVRGPVGARLDPVAPETARPLARGCWGRVRICRRMIITRIEPIHKI